MDKTIQKALLRRLKIIEGQVRGLHKMVSNEDYCVDIIQQSVAVKHALSNAEDLILKNHLSTHVIEDILKGNKDKSIEEILSIFKMSKKK
ncbi:hypothetical protein CO046_03725 [Candidatus Peregrinibacteria bacterium CG_4_9_14_0_2_um_filter_53_11]|nr:MAG: hypothetical protein CO046_03725 [Candidatus Peregrinibacteria bacterium CG_4_9_14_0_2_um_filter_53_11]